MSNRVTNRPCSVQTWPEDLLEESCGPLRKDVLLPSSAVWAHWVAGFHTHLWGRLDPSDCVLMTVNLKLCIGLSIILQI